MRRIGAIREEFASIQAGDTRREVEGKLASAMLTGSALPAPFWNERQLSEEDEKRIKSSIGQRIDTFFLPVTFVVSFDEAGRVVGKHIYD